MRPVCGGLSDSAPQAAALLQEADGAISSLPEYLPFVEDALGAGVVFGVEVGVVLLLLAGGVGREADGAGLAADRRENAGGLSVG